MIGSEICSSTVSIDAWLEKLRAEKPLVQCITNFVSMDIMANALLAIGASPAMVRHGGMFTSLYWCRQHTVWHPKRQVTCEVVNYTCRCTAQRRQRTSRRLLALSW